MKSSVCHSGVVLMKTEYMNQAQRSSTARQHNTPSAIITTAKQVAYFQAHCAHRDTNYSNKHDFQYQSDRNTGLI
jgi:hypothetical protein